jgi:hypothetical protein
MAHPMPRYGALSIKYFSNVSLVFSQYIFSPCARTMPGAFNPDRGIPRINICKIQLDRRQRPGAPRRQQKANSKSLEKCHRLFSVSTMFICLICWVVHSLTMRISNQYAKRFCARLLLVYPLIVGFLALLARWMSRKVCRQSA